MPETRRIRAGRQHRSVDGAAPGGSNRGQAQKITRATGSDSDSNPSDTETVVRCTCCGHPLSAPESVARERGPVCAARKGVQE
ncbi:DUF6011 domain-containing protein [Rhodococcus ruber]|uniref:DUF6011 domain-containing protein n=1 Tax=Rhodococcus ruber TaxID=1830 RepID=UPI0039999D05